MRTNSFLQDSYFSWDNSQVLLQMKNMNLSPIENSPLSVNNQLRAMVFDYLKKHNGLTLNALSQRCGVPATTMRRLMQEEQRQELAPHSVLALTSYLLKEKNISKLLRLVTGPVAELLNRSFDQFIFNETSSSHKMETDLNTLLQDKISYIIYKLAANNCGTNVQTIKDIFGLTGLLKLNELINKNWIIADINNPEILHAKEKNFTIDLALAQNLTHSLLDFYKPNDVQKGYNLFYSLSEGLNEVGIKAVKEIEKNAVKKIYEIMSNKEFQGEIPYFTIMISEVLGLTPNNDSNTGVLQ